MLATTIQITNNPPHTPKHQQHKAAGWLRGQPPQHVADAHTVLNVNPTVCSSAKNFLCPTQNAPTPTTHQTGDKNMQAQENNHTPTTTGKRNDYFPQKWAP